MYNLVHSVSPSKKLVRVSAMVIKFIIKETNHKEFIVSKYGTTNEFRVIEKGKSYRRRKFSDWDSLNLISMSLLNHTKFFFWFQYEDLERLQKEFPILKGKKK